MKLRAVFAAAVLGLTSLTVCTTAHAATFTQANDVSRTSWYPDQPGLSPQVVTSGSFGQKFAATVDGSVLAQPLVADDTLIVATENDNAYGLDPRTGQQRWTRNFGTPFAIQQDQHLANCTDIVPNIGVTSTPVIDAANHVVYMVGKIVENGVPAYDMHKLSTITGQEQPGFPVRIGGVADNDPTHSFVARNHLQRPGLLLLDGVVYAAFGSHCVINPYEGWVFGVTTSGQVAARWTDEAGHPQTDQIGGGIWMSGTGLLSDGPGQIVLATGAPGLSASQPTPGKQPPNELGQSVVRLTVQSDGKLKPTDFFTPENAAALSSTDSDVGSGGVVALPPQPFSTAQHPNLFMQVGKAGQMYLLDAANLGGFKQGPGGSDAVVRRTQDNGVWGKPGLWPGDGGWAYFSTAGGGKGPGQLEALHWGLDANGVPNMTLLGVSTDQFGFGSSSVSVTSNGTQSGSALVWVIWIPTDAVSSGAGAQLRAYNPVPVNGQMQMVWSAPVGAGTKFAPPAIDNNTVYVPTRDGRVVAFGSPVPTPMTAGGIDFNSTVIGSSDNHNETFTANTSLTVTSIQTTGPFQAGTPTIALNTPMTAGQNFDLPLTFAPISPGQSAGSVKLTTSEGPVTFPLSGYGLSPGPDLTVYPPTANFGRVKVGTTANNSIILTNQGAQPATLSGTEIPGSPYAISGLPSVGTTIASGQSVTANIVYSPTTVESDDARIEIDSDGGNITVPLIAAGGTPPHLVISNETVHFGSVPLGATASETIVMQNTGGTSMVMEKSKPPINSDGFNSVAPIGEGVAVQAGKANTLRVNFTASAVGTHSATWLIEGDDDTGRHTVTYDATVVQGPTPRVSIGDAQVTLPTSGNTTAQFPVTLTRASSSPITVNFTTKDGTILAGSGYDAYSGSLTFAAGETSKVLSVTVHGTDMTTTQTFSTNLTTASGAVIEDGTAKAYVANLVLFGSLIAEDATVSRPANGSATALDYRVTMTGLPPGRSATVVAATADGTLTAAAGDYTPVTRTLTFSSDGAQVVSVPILHPPAAGANGTVFLGLSSASTNAKIADNRGTGTIVGGTPPLPTLYTDSVSLVRPDAGSMAAATFTTRLSAPSASVVQVLVKTGTDPVFVAGTDYVPVPGLTLTFQPGQTSQSFTVPIIGSSTSTGVGTVPISISKPSNAIVATAGVKAWVVSPTRRTLLAPVSTVGWVSPFESTTLPVPVSIAYPVDTDTTFTAATSDGTALAGTDYVATSATLTIPAHSTTATLNVPIKPGVPGVDKTFIVTLSNNGSATVTDATATATLVRSNGASTPVPSVAPTLTSAAAPTTALVGQPVSYQFAASGNPTPTFTIGSGALPPGITLDPTGLLAGTPSSPGSYSWTVKAANAVNPAATSPQLTMTVTGQQQPHLIAASPPASATVGNAYSFTFTANGSPTPQFAVASGAIPPGLSLDTTGLLSGTPTTAGSYTFQVCASNTAGTDLSSAITVTVGPQATAPQITASSPPSAATQGQAYSYYFTASGTPAPNWALGSGALPPGMSLISTTGELRGTPTATGTFTFTATASNGIAPDATTAALTINVSPAPAAPQFVTAQPPTSAVSGSAYSYQFTATGVPSPTFSVPTGQMPAGLSLDPVSGLLSGVPNISGTFTFKVQASNGVGAPALTPNLTITVSNPPPSTDVQMIFTGPSVVSAGSAGVYGVAAKNVGATVTAVNNVLTLSIPSGAVVGTLPAGVTQVGNTLVYSAGSIAPGKNAKFSVSITLPNTQTLTASTSSDTPDPVPANNTASITTTVR